MKILYVYGKEKGKDVIHGLRKIGYEVKEYARVQKLVFLDDDEIDGLVKEIEAEDITFIMSIHLIYNAAVAADRTGVKYISIIWDAPYMDLYTPFGRLDKCWFSTFDKVDCAHFLRDGIPHVLYQPLSVGKKNIVKWNAGRRKYINEVAFVGSLYDINLYDKYLPVMPAEFIEYFTTIFEDAAFKWDGINRIYGRTSNEMMDYMKKASSEFLIWNLLDVDDARYFEAYYLMKKVANIERVCVLNMLAEQFRVTLYTNQNADVSGLINVKVMPPVCQGRESSSVFAGSKINLNISVKGIEGGTPQRIMDIMGAGGFVMTNYCPETGELFVEDKEIVMFRTPEELLEKTAFYLTHDAEREKIARAGQEKVLTCYTYEKKLKQLMEWVMSDGKSDIGV